MKKLRLLLGLLIVVIFTIAVLSLLFFNKKRDNDFSASIKDRCEDISDLSQQEDCYINLAIEEKNPSYCNKLSKTKLSNTGQRNQYDNCQMQFATYFKEILFCYNFTSHSYEGPTGDCIYNISIATKNKTACQLLWHDSASECEKEIDRVLGNSYNLNIDSHINYLEECYKYAGTSTKNLSEDVSWCTQETYNNSLYGNKIPSKEDIDKFKLLNNTVIKQLCQGGSSMDCGLQKYSSNCSRIWKATFYYLGVRPEMSSYSVHQCNQEYYLIQEASLAEGGAYNDWIYRIQLDENTINNLKS